ncbi:hypothetical protein PRIPAC_74580 [Pristionchus pacificus]|uniref:Uncharacterized protein n=1 Tax=Pristionchus pacificus TaxID=54126 RepID=A0A2A6CF57_PRIPA|nr:hypothetical protein PRIPAC_74580 [Pristionchus pacificus]|eukprot:PDM76746.1 hypothetical protein PRIPAC_42141 [Pristionchus pacificus]
MLFGVLEDADDDGHSHFSYRRPVVSRWRDIENTVISIEFYLGSQTHPIFAFILTEEFWKNCFRRHAVWSQLTSAFTEESLVFNGLQAIVNPLIVLWLTPEYRKLLKRKEKKKRITYVAFAVPNYTQGILRDATGKPISLSKKPEESLFSRYCSKV